MNFVDFLHSVPEFSKLRYSELERLETSMEIKEFPDGHEFIREGTKGNDVYLLLEGRVSVSHRVEGAGHSVELKQLSPGEFFGMVALIDNGRRAATCTAIGKVRVACLPRSAFVLLYQSDSELGHVFLDLVAHQLVRDYRALTGALRKALFSPEDDLGQLARDLISQYSGSEQGNLENTKYTGPERRRGERRQTRPM